MHTPLQIPGKNMVEIRCFTHRKPPQDQREFRETIHTKKTKTRGQFDTFACLLFVTLSFTLYFLCRPFSGDLSVSLYSCNSCLWLAHGSHAVIKRMACHLCAHAVLRAHAPRYSNVHKCVYMSVNFIQWKKRKKKKFSLPVNKTLGLILMPCCFWQNEQTTNTHLQLNTSQGLGEDEGTCYHKVGTTSCY